MNFAHNSLFPERRKRDGMKVGRGAQEDKLAETRNMTGNWHIASFNRIKTGLNKCHLYHPYKEE